MKRIFTALIPSESVRKEIRRFAASLPDLPVRWIEDHNLHLTIIPPWEVQDIERVSECLKTAVRDIRPFEIQFTEISFGPDSRQPRLIWATGKPCGELLRLKTNLERELAIESGRSLIPHLTLGRFHPEDFANFPLKTLRKQIVWVDRFDAAVLMESRRGRGGADYEILKRCSFK